MDVNYFANFPINSSKMASNLASMGMELSSFLTRGNPTLSNRDMILQADASSYLLDATKGVPPSSSAYLVLASTLS